MSELEYYKKISSTSNYIRKFFEGFQSFPSISKHFQRFPKNFENFQKVMEDRFENFPAFFYFFQDFWRFPKTSDNFQRFQKCWKVVLSTSMVAISKMIWRFPKTSEDFRWFLKIKKKNAGRLFLALCDICQFFSKDFGWLPEISEDFQRFPKISKNFGNLLECLIFALSCAFS